MTVKYVPDLTRQMALCEANYARLLKLLPDMENCLQRDFIVDMGEGEYLVSLKVQERFKYTCTLSVAQKSINVSKDAMIDSLMSPELIVRLYHDAKMAEVISPNKKSQYSGKYSYPNKEMYQVDEKIQLNEYLGQWLTHCVTHGYQRQNFIIDKFAGSN